MPAFAAAVTCIDGRFNVPLVAWMRAAFGVDRADLARAAEGVPTHLRDRAHVVALHLGADGTVVPLSEHGAHEPDPATRGPKLATGDPDPATGAPGHAQTPDHEAHEQPTRTGASR